MNAESPVQPSTMAASAVWTTLPTPPAPAPAVLGPDAFFGNPAGAAVLARDDSPDFSHIPPSQRQHPTRDAGIVFDPFAPTYETASPAYGVHGGGQSPALEQQPQSPVSNACDFEVQLRLMQEQLMQQQLMLAQLQMQTAAQ